MQLLAYKNRRILAYITLTLFLIALLLGCSAPDATQPSTAARDQPAQAADQQTTPPSSNPGDSAAAAPAAAAVPGTLKVHFLDVGQADCVLVRAPSGKNMLIDAGNNGDADTILSYIRNQGISKLDIVVGTHPHEDHIGSLDKIINTFDTGQVVMPNATTTTRTFEDVLTAIQNKGLKITAAKPGVALDLGAGIMAAVIAPNGSKYEDLNNYSAVIRLTFGSTSFLFTGDAGSISEFEILASSRVVDLKSTVLKVGHHGSSYSSSQAFLDKVRPQYAVISVGKDNDYGHPAKETLDKLAAIGAKVYRTDQHGTIVATSDGSKVSFTTFKP